MGRRGPVPKTALRALHGDMSVSWWPGVSVPVPPGWLDAAGLARFEELADRLAGVATAADSTGLAVLATLTLQWEAAVADVAERGLTVVDERGVTRRNPTAIAAKTLAAEIRSWCREFGLTPLGRQAIPARRGERLPGERLLTGGGEGMDRARRRRITRGLGGGA